MRKWIQQHIHSHNCGAIAVAVVAGISVLEAEKAIGKSGCTRTKDLVKALRSLGFTCPDRCKPMPRPNLGIAQMRTPGRRSGWHWVVVDGDKIWDGWYGGPSGKVLWPQGSRMTSFLPVNGPVSPLPSKQEKG